MTTEQLRELDAWIAVNVMGWHPFKGDDGMRCETCGNSVGGQFKHWMRKWEGICETLPRYTTSPADAMRVLEGCAAKTLVEIVALANGKWFVSSSDYTVSKHCGTEADTLPLAICLFARQLFSK